MQDGIYLDNAATTRTAPEVCEAVLDAMRERYGNPSSLHGMGLDAERLLNEARAEVAKTLSVPPARLFFVASGSEANNTAIFGLCARAPRVRGESSRARRILTTRTEHPSVLRPLAELGARGWQIEYIEVDGHGAPDLGQIEQKLRESGPLAEGDSVDLIALTHVNNETGAIAPVEQVGALRDRLCPGAALLVDCVQSFGKFPAAPERWGADFVSISAHKIHGPKGVGALYLSERFRIPPLVYGGGQEGGLRSGTENVPAIAGFGLAARLAREGLAENARRVGALRQRLLCGLDALSIPCVGISGAPPAFSPYIAAVAFPGIRSEVLLHHLSREGVYVSSGSACSAKRREKAGSHVLNAMGLDRRLIDGAIRFSLSRDTTETEIDRVVALIGQIVPGL
ncbi:MAG: cysteine desulfurase [Clostridiales bacterium]|jgi:cysteine desulfurase|nr:cysteine desulfurase [Clostridiales bacterium]